MKKEMMDDSMTKSEVLEATKKLVDLVKDVKKQNLEDVSAMDKFIKEASNNAKNDTSKSFKELKGNITALVDKLVLDSNTTLTSKIEELDQKMSEIKNGEDADEDRVAEKVYGMIKIPTIEELKDQLPVMGEEVRDALELLQDEEMLDVSAIKGIKELLEEYTEKTNKSALAYVGSAHRPTFVDDETPSGTVNGTNKAFDTNLQPSPATSLMVFVDGQKTTITEDYTVSGQTITFVTAPPTGSVIRIFYRA